MERCDNKLYAELKKIIAAKLSLRDPLIEILREAQGLFGYLPQEVQVFIAEQMDMPVNKVYAVVTFYNFFSMTPRGKFVINVCTGTACYVKGATKVIEMMEQELGIALGQTSQDGKFTLSSVRCVGACSLAPVVVIGEDTYGKVATREQVKELLSKY